MNKIWVAVLLAISLSACRKGNLDPISSANNTVPVTVLVNQNQAGYPVSERFEGLSYETRILTASPDFLNENNTVLIQLIKNLGDGVLRIGGNSSDEIHWAGAAETKDSTTNSLTGADIDRLSAFANAIGWKVLFGLNLGNNNAGAAANEAAYVQKSLGYNLYALQSGNEPDVFKLGLRAPNYNYKNYQQEWNTYFSAVRKVLPGARFAGPDVTPYNPNWINSFSENEHNNIRLIDAHYYSTGPASNPLINYQNILAPNEKLDGYLLQLSRISARYHLPYRISECNSVFGGGKQGVSDVFASALWALDFMWKVAENHGQGINFHGGGSLFHYTPVTVDRGTVSARPEYYAMLAFKYGCNSCKVIPATIADPRSDNNCSVYSCLNADNTFTVTLINKEDAKNFSFTVQLSNPVSAIQVARLSAPAVSSASGTTFAGSTVNADGTFTPGTIEQHAINQKSFVVNVPAGSAAVITIR